MEKGLVQIPGATNAGRCKGCEVEVHLTGSGRSKEATALQGSEPEEERKKLGQRE